MGESMGGLLSFNMSIRFPKLFTGLALVAPYFQNKSDSLDKYKWVLKFCNTFQLFY